MVEIGERPARYVAGALKQLAAHYYRNALQHGQNSIAEQFMREPIVDLSERIRGHIPDLAAITPDAQGNVPSLRNVLPFLPKLECFVAPVSEYDDYDPAQLIWNQALYRKSDLPVRMLSVIGSERRPSNVEEDALISLGRELAAHRIVVVVENTHGFLEPFLQGFKDMGGLSIGIMHKREVNVDSVSITDPDGLITFPVVGLKDSESLDRTIMTLMSGRATLALGGNERFLEMLEVASHEAYFPCPTILINVPEFTNQEYRHNLQEYVGFEQAVGRILNFIPSDSGMPKDDNYYYLQTDPRKTPVSIFCGTSYKANHATREFTERLAARLADEEFVTITGSGPAAMADFARFAQAKSLTVGVNFFPTFLCANPYIDIPIVSNAKMERSDEMVLSANSIIYLGGSSASGAEMARTRRFAKPVINCSPTFDMEDLNGYPSKRGLCPFVNMNDPEEAMRFLLRLRTEGHF